MTTVGYGDIIPITLNEKVFAICSMILASGSFAYVLGSFGGLVERSTEESSDYRTRLTSVNRYMKIHKIPMNTSFRVRRYLEYRNEHKQDDYKNEEQMLSVLSEALREEIYDFVNGAALKLFPVFKSIEETFVTKLSKHLDRSSFSPGDTIISQNEYSTDLFFVMTGQVQVLHNSSVIKALGPDSYFGEISFFLKIPRCASVQCSTFVQLMYLSRVLYLQSLETFPSINKYFSELVHTCEKGDLTRISVRCFSCQELGHVASKCINSSISRRKVDNRNKWIESKKVRTKYINPNTPTENAVRRHPHRNIHIKPSFFRVVGLPFDPEDAYPSSPRLRLLVNKAELPERSPAIVIPNEKSDIWEKPDKLEQMAEVEEDCVSSRYLAKHYSRFFEDDSSQPQTPLETRGNTFRKELVKQFAQHPPIVDIERYIQKPTTRAGSVSYRSSESSFSKEADRIMFAKGKRGHLEGVTD